MIYEIKTFADDATNRVIYARVPQALPGESFPTQYIGAAALQINPQQQANFQFPIEANNITEAFANYDGAHAVAERDMKQKIVDQQRQALLMSAAQPAVNPAKAAQAILNGGRRVR